MKDSDARCSQAADGDDVPDVMVQLSPKRDTPVRGSLRPEGDGGPGPPDVAAYADRAGTSNMRMQLPKSRARWWIAGRSPRAPSQLIRGRWADDVDGGCS